MPEARTGSRGRSGARAGKGAARGGAAAAGAEEAAREDRVPGAEGRAGAHVCPVAFCPVGMALTFAEASRPEVVQHLMAAGQELLLAVKAMIDARAEAATRGSGIERITIQ